MLNDVTVRLNALEAPDCFAGVALACFFRCAGPGVSMRSKRLTALRETPQKQS